MRRALSLPAAEERLGWGCAGVMVALNLGGWQACRAETGGHPDGGEGRKGFKGGWHPQDQPHPGGLFTYNGTGTQGGRLEKTSCVRVMYRDRRKRQHPACLQGALLPGMVCLERPPPNLSELVTTSKFTPDALLVLLFIGSPDSSRFS